MANNEWKEIDLCIATLGAFRPIREAYASSSKGTQIADDVISALAITDSLLCQNVSTAIHAWLHNRAVQQIGYAA